jgi:acyl-coenzyme A synthetase/AMP-(fatty) acid ligase
MSYQNIQAVARELPAQNAVVYNGTAVSYTAFAGAIETSMGYLRAEELCAEQTVIVLVRNLLDCWVVVLALQHLGINTICVASTLVIDALALSDATVVVTTELELPQHQIVSWVSAENRIVTVPNPVYDSVPARSESAPGEDVTAGGHILYTSGTTGKYKKLLYSAELQQARDVERGEYDGYNKYTLFHCTSFGLWTAVGYRIPRTIWRASGCVVLDQRPNWQHHFLQSGMTHSILVPDLVNQLLDALPELSVPALPLDFMLSVSGGFVSRKSAEQLLSRVTKCVRNVYGSTETNAYVLTAMVSDLDALHWLSPSAYRAVEIVDDAGNPCADDVAGQLRVRQTGLDCTEYLDDPQTSERVFRSGYYYPGDMAVRRADGCIRILGRSADVINYRGQKIAAAPIEQEIQLRLGVTSVCLFSGIDSRGEVEIVVALETSQHPARSALEALNREFTQFDRIQYALYRQFPRTQTGTSKIDRVALRKLVFPEPERSA